MLVFSAYIALSTFVDALVTGWENLSVLVYILAVMYTVNRLMEDNPDKLATSSLPLFCVVVLIGIIYSYIQI